MCYVLFLPVNIISDRHKRSIEPGTSLITMQKDELLLLSSRIPAEIWPTRGWVQNTHLSQNLLAFSIFCWTWSIFLQSE
jgi:hypothetical protein